MRRENGCHWTDGYDGAKDCRHDWDWEGGYIGARYKCTYPARQHRTCKQCARRECVTLNDNCDGIRELPEGDVTQRQIDYFLTNVKN